MNQPRNAANPCLAALIAGSGYPSHEQFAAAVNAHAYSRYGVLLSYDHVTVKRWLRGSTCQHADIVAHVLSQAWGIPISPAVIWPEARAGGPAVPAHLQAWVAARTLDDLATFVRSDMLTRREMLAEAIGVAAGAAFLDPIRRWLDADALGVRGDSDEGPGQIGMNTVRGIEQTTQKFASDDADTGGGLSREAAVGQLKYAVDLLQHGRYTQQVGDRLLAAVAELAGLVGWMSHDVGMDGPAQKYFIYGLQAARESSHERAGLLAVELLSNLARQARALGHPDTGLRLVDLALERLPDDRRHPTVRAVLWNLKGRMYAGLGPAYTREMRHAVSLSFDIHDDAEPADDSGSLSYCDRAELSGVAASAFRDLARDQRSFSYNAERHVLDALALRAGGFTRSRVFDQIGLTRARFMMGEPEQACDDGDAALDMATEVAASRRVIQRLSELLADSQPYEDLSAVRDFRERLHLVTAA